MKFTPLTDVDMAPFMGLPLDLFSYDDGYHAKKSFSTRMPEGVVLRTLMGRTSARMTTSRAVLNTEGIMGAELKDETGPMRHLFGHHAAQQFSNSQLTTKASDELAGQVNSKLLQFFRATLSMAFPVPGTYRANGVVMMPVASIAGSVGFKVAVKNALQGVHTFTALTGFDSDDGTPQYGTWNVLVQDVLVVEQPLGSLFKVGLDPDEDGPDMQVLQSAKNTFLDWGMGTLDVFTTEVVYNAAGEPSILRVDQMCGTAPAGIHMLFDYIRSEVLEPAGLNPTPVKLEEAVMAGRFKEVRRKDLRSPLADEHGYIDLKPVIAAAIEEMWSAALELFETTIGLTAEDIDNIFITGGPAGWMEPYVVEHFDKDRVFTVLPEHIVNDPKHPYRYLMQSKDLHLRNAQGGYLLALRTANRL